MTTDKLTGLAFITAMLLCFGISMADSGHASEYKPKPTHTIKVKTVQHIYCPYKGCKGKFH